MNKNDCIIRLEKKEDYRKIESLVRESFWNVYRPGCSEHYVIHVLREDSAFVKELDFVMEKDGSLIGQNMFMKTAIKADDGRVIDVLTMGPISIIPELKSRGYGKVLLIILWRKLQGLASEQFCLKAALTFTERVDLIMPANSASDIMIFRKMRMRHFFSARK